LGFAKSPDFRNKALKSFARTHKEEEEEEEHVCVLRTVNSE
jgi:hypothetical protein